jgi:DNA gyrase subunit A
MQEIDLIANEDIVITISNHGYIKRQTTVNFKAQRRGGVGKSWAAAVKRKTILPSICSWATTHDYVLFFTNKGRAYQLRGYEIPEAGRTAKGTAIINLLPFAPGERITAVINGSTFGAAKYLFMATNHGSVKKTKVEDFASVQ